jgi:hypothetical protein
LGIAIADGLGTASQATYRDSAGNLGTGKFGLVGASFKTVTSGNTSSSNHLDIYADLSSATAATINQLRQAFQTQRLLERDARGGSRYTEILRSHFGVSSPDARLQRPEYLGGSSVPAGTPGSGSESGADCKDGKKTNFETDTDCGGRYCPKCIDGKKCIGDADCVSGSCVSGTCAKAAETCDDGILNGSEGDTDCGGTCPDRCGSGRKCKVSSDCLVGVTCNTGICNGGPTCFDKIQNGNESDTDCGGSDCIKCDVGEMCKSSSDCKSGTCTSGRCK